MNTCKHCNGTGKILNWSTELQIMGIVNCEDCTGTGIEPKSETIELTEITPSELQLLKTAKYVAHVSGEIKDNEKEIDNVISALGELKNELTELQNKHARLKEDLKAAISKIMG